MFIPWFISHSHSMISFSGYNFLIQRLPDEQEIGDKHFRENKELLQRESEVPILARPPDDNDIYRRQPSDPSPTTICKKLLLIPSDCVKLKVCITFT